MLAESFIAEEEDTMQLSERELAVDTSNPIGIEGIEFIEYSTSKPQALGQVLEMMGFHPIARHRSREVLLYRQGEMNVIVNAHAQRQPRAAELTESPVIAAIAVRVHDAAAAYRPRRRSGAQAGAPERARGRRSITSSRARPQARW